MHGVAVQVFTQLSGISKLRDFDFLLSSLTNDLRCNWLLPSAYV